MRISNPRCAAVIFLVALSIIAAPSRAAAADKFIAIHEGKFWKWYAREDVFNANRADIERLYQYADDAFDYLQNAWGLRPPAEKYALLVRVEKGGGFAAGDIDEVRAITNVVSPGIGVSFDAFAGSDHNVKGYWAYVLITHEMANLFTGQIVSGGWPVDWWANHRSPFPLMTALQVEYALVPEVAIHHAKQRDDPLVQMFLDLKDRYGWQMFREAFKAAIADGIKWDRIGENPSALRTNYVAAYLQIGAAGDVFSFLKGKVPNFDETTANEIIEARTKWRSLPEGSAERKKLQEKFLVGER